MNEQEQRTLEANLVRIQAAVDELTDTLAKELNQVYNFVENGNTDAALKLLSSMILAAGTFTEPDPEEEEEEEEEE